MTCPGVWIVLEAVCDWGSYRCLKWTGYYTGTYSGAGGIGTHHRASDVSETVITMGRKETTGLKP